LTVVAIREPAMRLELARVLVALLDHGIDVVRPIEHSIVPNLLRHQCWLTVPPRLPLWSVWRAGMRREPINYGGGTVLPRLVIEHPEACGCDLLPDHVLLEG
jgi:hypothetical protein